eukprot:TRINITY_DN207_c0_g1_i1.p1 TRINITY_DN207_c0_g1~~TRINITY_DN207_c0_g1_i1.p1  ORF type:complete len:367 (-),score=102.02 TRINITY_DN207_c0_g1_i1:10-1110(-)
MTEIKTIFTPHQMGDLTLKNRIAMPPLTRGRSSPVGVPETDLKKEYYRQRADLGLIISEGVQVSPQAYGWRNGPGIWTEEQVEAWKPVVDAVHEDGGVIFMQLWHLGRAAHSDFFGLQPVAASAIAIENTIYINDGSKVPYEVPRALEEDEIPSVIEDFRKAAENAKAAGFDGVEIHGANGYILDNFTQSKTNQRTDSYGGSLENRLKLPLEVVEAVLTVFPANRVGYRISPNGSFNDMGSPDYRETFTELIKKLAEYDLGYLHVMDGLAFGFHELGAPFTLSEARPLFPNTIIGNCGYTKEDAEKRINDGDADLIAIGRPVIANPDIMRRFKEDLPLNDPDYSTFYTDGAEGYTDYPYYTAEEEN